MHSPPGPDDGALTPASTGAGRASSPTGSSDPVRATAGRARYVRRLGRWDDDCRTPRPPGFVDADRVRGGVSGDAHKRAPDRGEQIEGGGRIITRRLG